MCPHFVTDQQKYHKKLCALDLTNLKRNSYSLQYYDDNKFSISHSRAVLNIANMDRDKYLLCQRLMTKTEDIHIVRYMLLFIFRKKNIHATRYTFEKGILEKPSLTLIIQR